MLRPRQSGSGWRALVDAADGPAGAEPLARALGDWLRGLPATERADGAREILGELLAVRRAYGPSLFLLAELDDEALVPALADALLPLPDRLHEADEAHLAELVRVVASAPETAGHRVVADYLLERPSGPHWSTVVWALWPRRKALFGSAWSRWFETTDPSAWTDGAVLEPFLATPEAVVRVRDTVQAQRRSGWPPVRDAIDRRAHRCGWLSDEQRRALAAALG